MAKKGTVGNAYHRSQQAIDRMIAKIDARSANGEDRDNVDDQSHRCSFSEDGERVWSY